MNRRLLHIVRRVVPVCAREVLQVVGLRAAGRTAQDGRGVNCGLDLAVRRDPYARAPSPGAAAAAAQAARRLDGASERAQLRAVVERHHERVAVQLAQDERTDAVSRCHGGADPLACARSSTGVRCDRAGHRPYEGCVGFVACSRVGLRARVRMLGTGIQRVWGSGSGAARGREQRRHLRSQVGVVVLVDEEEDQLDARDRRRRRAGLDAQAHEA